MKKIITYIIILCALLPLHTHAQKYTLLEPLPCIPDAGVTCTEGQTIKEMDIVGFVGYVFKFSIALAAFLAVLMIMWGGFEYMTSETPFGKSDGKDRITNAIVGLLGILSSYLILATIDPRLVEIYTDIPAIKIDTRDAISFQNQLYNDIANLDKETILEANTLTQKIADNKKKIAGYEAQDEAMGLTEEEEKEYQVLKDETKKLEVKEIDVRAGGIMNAQFRIAIDRAQQQKSLWDSDIKLIIKGAEEKIEQTYTNSNTSLKTIGGSESIDLDRQLLLTKGFYKSEIAEESRLTQAIEDEVMGKKNAEDELRSIKKNFEKEIKELEDPLKTQDEASGFKTDKKLQDLRLLLLKARVERINKALE